MNYYIQGSAARAEQIKAAFEKLGYRSTYVFNAEMTLYFTFNGEIKTAVANSYKSIIKTHPDYKELKLPVEPKFKFKVGDWIVQNDNGTVSQITKTINGKDEYGEYRAYEHTNGYFAACFENEYHLWTIQDAKDGDVLVTTKIRSCPFIYRKTDAKNNLAYYYAGINGNGDFCEGCLKRTLYHFGPVANLAPATKEQRDLLFKKMKEAGYEWDEKKKELCRIINPKFKVGDNIKTGNTVETIAEVDHATRRYYCESGRTISFENQDLWHLAPKPHYDIKNFKPFDKVLVRCADDEEWAIEMFSKYYDDSEPTIHGRTYRFMCIADSYTQCIPFEGNEKLLGTTDMCDKQYINW